MRHAKSTSTRIQPMLTTQVVHHREDILSTSAIHPPSMTYPPSSRKPSINPINPIKTHPYSNEPFPPPTNNPQNLLPLQKPTPQSPLSSNSEIQRRLPRYYSWISCLPISFDSILIDWFDPMACLCLRTAGGIAAARMPDRDGRFRIPTGPNRVSFRSAAVVAKVAMVQCKEVPQLKDTPGGGGGGGGTDISGGAKKFDRWMRESVTEIVKNLEEAPLLVHVYGDDLGTRLKTEKAVAEDWTQMKGKWVKGEEPSPEGIILVEELKEDDVGILEEDGGQFRDCTKAWGVLIQGKGEDGGVGCYLLKTSKVGCGGVGVFSTHYSLVRVNSFRETLKSQLTKCWLA